MFSISRLALTTGVFSRMFIFLAGILGLCGYTGAQNRTLIVIFDGMRADYITPELTPALWKFRENASRAENHHSVFPTVTRVNSASFATGAYPGSHGLMGNSVFFPKVRPNRAIGTTYEDLSKVIPVENGELLTAVSAGEVFDSKGQRMMVFSSGTSGQAFLQNYKVGKGAIVNPSLILPESFRNTVVSAIGDPEVHAKGLDKHRWVVDALLRFGLVEGGPLVTTVWLSDPDGAGHKGGIGSEELKTALAFVDAEFARILKRLEEKGWENKFNIIATTDHGFVTYLGKESVEGLLISEGIKESKESDDVVLAGGAIYVKDRDKQTIRRIVEVLHKTPWIGAVFTKGKAPGDMKGWVPGTFSLESVHFDHKTRGADILVAVNWNDEKNSFGYPGSDFSVGVAGHGGSSPYEIGIKLFARGPDFKNGYVSTQPSSIIDIFPTVLKIYGYPIPGTMNGRPLEELLKKGKAASEAANHDVLVTEASYPWGTYKLRLDISTLGSRRYFNFSSTERVMK